MDIYNKVLSFVPAEYQSDSLYIVPTGRHHAASMSKKRACKSATASPSPTSAHRARL